MLPPIRPDANKYTRGSLLVLAGSGRFPGAAVLAAKAAARTGAGYVTLAIPEPALLAAQSHLLSVPVLAAKADDGAFAADAWVAIRAGLRHIDAVVIGPGLTVTPSTRVFVESVLLSLRQSGIPALIDADALNILAATGQPECPGLLGRLSDGRTPSTLFVLTPHAGELQRLSAAAGVAGGSQPRGEVVSSEDGEGSVDSESADSTFCHCEPDLQPEWTDSAGAAVLHGHDTVDVAKALAAMLNAVVVAKGPVTQIVAADSSHSSSTGTAALAKAGTGDVLSGIIGSLLAQGMLPFEAAKLGVELLGQAGRLAEQNLGQRSVCAEDLLETLPLVLKGIEG